ncbi:hypothetical protein VTN02DRAFT_4850 [Thermoascus thermophilus]
MVFEDWSLGRSWRPPLIRKQTAQRILSRHLPPSPAISALPDSAHRPSGAPSLPRVPRAQTCGCVYDGVTVPCFSLHDIGQWTRDGYDSGTSEARLNRSIVMQHRRLDKKEPTSRAVDDFVVCWTTKSIPSSVSLHRIRQVISSSQHCQLVPSCMLVA